MSASDEENQNRAEIHLERKRDGEGTMICYSYFDTFSLQYIFIAKFANEKRFSIVLMPKNVPSTIQLFHDTNFWLKIRWISNGPSKLCDRAIDKWAENSVKIIDWDDEHTARSFLHLFETIASRSFVYITRFTKSILVGNRFSPLK